MLILKPKNLFKDFFNFLKKVEVPMNFLGFLEKLF
jgi:hypothetical protein